MRPVVHVTDDVGAVAGALVAAALGAASRRSGRARLGIAGGSSPLPVFRWLADHLAVDGVVVTWVDERHDPAHANAAGAEEHWFSRACTPVATVPMLFPDLDLAGARAAYERRFIGELGGLDAVLLGAGPDGHIASLFPGHPALDATGVCVAIHDSPKPPPERLSLTLPVLEAVDCAVLVATGMAKAEAIRRALGGALPLGRYAPRGAYHWVLDPAAASLLPVEPP